jgi:hypothetical protein
MTDQATSTLRQQLRGRLIQPSDADYDAARALYHGMIDERPRLIACCVDVADVIAAVNVGREQGLLLPGPPPRRRAGRSRARCGARRTVPEDRPPRAVRRPGSTHRGPITPSRGSRPEPNSSRASPR